MKFCIVLSLLFVAVLAKPSPRQSGCVAPKVWEAVTYGYDHHTTYYSVGDMAYDAIGKQVRFVERIDANGTRSAYDTLYLYEKKTRYRIDQKTRKCTKEPLNDPFREVEIRPDSTYVGDAILGSLNSVGSGVIVQTWTHQSANATGIQIFTDMDCLPVEEEYIEKHADKYIHFHFTYSDLFPGVSSPEIFDVPKECL